MILPTDYTFQTPLGPVDVGLERIGDIAYNIYIHQWSILIGQIRHKGKNSWYAIDGEIMYNRSQVSRYSVIVYLLKQQLALQDEPPCQ